jgi:hypothetical protein
MTPEQQERANRLNKRINTYLQHGLDKAIYAICTELEAVAAAAVAVRSFYATELIAASSQVPLEDRLALFHTVASSIRITNLATTAMVTIEPLVQEVSTQEVTRALRWLAGPSSPVGQEGIQKLCEQIATTAPGPGAASVRALLERIYDLSPDQQEGDTNG